MNVGDEMAMTEVVRSLQVQNSGIATTELTWAPQYLGFEGDASLVEDRGRGSDEGRGAVAPQIPIKAQYPVGVQLRGGRIA